MQAGELSSEHAKAYKGAVIKNIHRGKGFRFEIVYASIYSAKDELLVSATLDYCVERMNDVSKYFDD